MLWSVIKPPPLRAYFRSFVLKRAPQLCAFVGHIVPTLGMSELKLSTIDAPRPRNLVAEALFPRVRHQLLLLLVGSPERTYYLNELVRLVGAGVGGVQRELESFARAGLVRVIPRANQRHYQANPDCVVFAELMGMARKTRDEIGRIALALAPLASRIDEAFVFGSVARGDVHAGSDIDLLLVSEELTLEDVLDAVLPLEAAFGRKINPTLLTRAVRARRIATANPFFQKIMAGPRVDLLERVPSQRPTAKRTDVGPI